MTCCNHCRDAGNIFDETRASDQLHDYRTEGEPTSEPTRRLVRGLKSLDLEGRTLLDVGGGVGVVPFELLDAGLAESTLVEASPSYLEVAEAEARRRGLADRTHHREGDVVEMADDLPDCDVVTLDRVVCCYPDLEAMVRATTDKAMRWYGVVYPKERWYNRLLEVAGNTYCWGRGDDFRIYIHENVDETIRSHGFSPFYDTTTWIWRITLYERDDAVA
jgi:magnesium-protoporphyrin O-methyltransferase